MSPSTLKLKLMVIGDPKFKSCPLSLTPDWC